MQIFVTACGRGVVAELASRPARISASAGSQADSGRRDLRYPGRNLGPSANSKS